MLVAAGLIWYFMQSTGSAPVSVPGITALYLAESSQRADMTREQLMLYTARGPGSLRTELEAASHKTDGTPDVRWVDQDSDLSRCIPAMTQIRARWDAAGRPPLWRHLTNGRDFFEGVPLSTSDELAKLNSLK